jgi:hypothetical protein
MNYLKVVLYLVVSLFFLTSCGSGGGGNPPVSDIYAFDTALFDNSNYGDEAGSGNFDSTVFN